MIRPPAIHARFDVRHSGFTLQTQLELPGRGVTALFGHSGAGKTTLLRAIAGLERHRGGFLQINDEVWQDDANGIFVPTHRRALGYVFQEPGLFAHLSVLRNLEFGWKRTDAAQRKVDMAHTVALLGIGHLLERLPAALSGGERQRIAIARALLTNPALLLMDEPLASLDMQRRQEVLPYLERIHDELNIPMIYVSHSADEVARLADHVVLLEEGKVLASGPIAAILARLDLPTALSDEAGVVIDGVTASFDEKYQLLSLQVAGGTIRVAHRRLPAGAPLRCRILARDVSLTLSPHADTSILNQLPALVLAETEATTPAHVIVRLDVGGMPLLARITRHSRDHLQIVPGKQAWVQFKAVAVYASS